MILRTKILPGGRTLVLGSLGATPDAAVQAPFVTLLPAFDERERERALALAPGLVELGCVELCCVGPESEALHDAIRGTLAATGAAGVVTTWDTDLARGCDYFWFAAGRTAPTRLALVAERPELVSLVGGEG